LLATHHRRFVHVAGHISKAEGAAERAEAPSGAPGFIWPASDFAENLGWQALGSEHLSGGASISKAAANVTDVGVD
jgi:hypothetical protein